MNIEAKSRLLAPTQVEAAKTANVTFADGSVRKVSYFSDPSKGRGTFSIKSPGLASIVFNKDSGKYVAYEFDNRKNGPDVNTAFKTGTADPKEAYLKAMKKFWKLQAKPSRVSAQSDTGESIFKKLTHLMGMDNGVTLKVTPAQKSKAIAAIDKMLAAGCKLSSADLSIIAGGDQDEADEKFVKFNGYKDLSAVLNQIFED